MALFVLVFGFVLLLLFPAPSGEILAEFCCTAKIPRETIILAKELRKVSLCSVQFRENLLFISFKLKSCLGFLESSPVYTKIDSLTF